MFKPTVMAGLLLSIVTGFQNCSNTKFSSARELASTAPVIQENTPNEPQTEKSPIVPTTLTTTDANPTIQTTNVVVGPTPVSNVKKASLVVSSYSCSVPVGGTYCTNPIIYTVSSSGFESINKIVIGSSLYATAGYRASVEIGVNQVMSGTFSPRYGSQSLFVADSEVDGYAGRNYDSKTITTSCAAPGVWNGTICKGPDAKSAQIVSANNCLISLGSSTCTSNLSVTSSGFVVGTQLIAVLGRFGTAGAVVNTNQTVSSLSLNLKYGATTLYLADSVAASDVGTGIYDAKDLTATCAAPGFWNGTICAPPPPPIVDYLVGPSSCIIPRGQSACSVVVTWLKSENGPRTILFDRGQYARGLDTTNAGILNLSLGGQESRLVARFAPGELTRVFTGNCEGTDVKNDLGTCVSVSDPSAGRCGALPIWGRGDVVLINGQYQTLTCYPGSLTGGNKVGDAPTRVMAEGSGVSNNGSWYAGFGYEDISCQYIDTMPRWVLTSSVCNKDP